MKAAIVDSSLFLSLEDPDERRHEDAREAFEYALADGVGLVTTNFVFDESYTLILARLGRNRAVAWGEALRASRVVRMVRVTAAHEARTWEILTAYADKPFSYTDATSFAVAEALDIDGALALDRHFVQWGRLEVAPT